MEIVLIGYFIVLVFYLWIILALVFSPEFRNSFDKMLKELDKHRSL